MAQQWRYPASPIPAAAGTAVTTAALTSGLGGLPLPQLPPIDRTGGRLDIDVQMEYTTVTGWTGTVVFAPYIGSVGQAIGSKTLLAATSAISLTAAATAWPILLHYSARFRALSPSAGTVYGQGWLMWGNALTTFGATVPFPITQALRTVSTLNTDQVNEIDFGITPSTTTDFTNVTVTDFAAEYSG